MSLDPTRGAGPRDALERNYTPPLLTEAIVRRLAELIEQPWELIEPSVGGGVFARAARQHWPDTHIVGVDPDPGAVWTPDDRSRRVQGPLTEAVFEGLSDPFALGNPPFSMALEHATLLTRHCPVVCLVLPWQIPCSKGFQSLLEGNPFAPVVGRPWDFVRPVGVFLLTWRVLSPAQKAFWSTPFREPAAGWWGERQLELVAL